MLHLLLYSLLSLGNLEPLETYVIEAVSMTVSLSCELYGYVSGLEITWQFENGTTITNESAYSITEDVGEYMIQNGGESPIPSVVSFLTIDSPTTSQTGKYTCLGGGMKRTISLHIGMYVLCSVKRAGKFHVCALVGSIQ